MNTVLEYLKYNRAPVRQSDFLELAQWRIPLASVVGPPLWGPTTGARNWLRQSIPKMAYNLEKLRNP